MQVVDEVLGSIKSRGNKLTEARHAIVESVYKSKTPLSAFDVLSQLHSHGVNVNKTTIYRELTFLLSEGFIREVKISPRKTHYESSQLSHHHHLICLDCGKVQEVICKELESPMKTFESRVLRKGFEIKDHQLEFYGRCNLCK